jgi:putative ABC transport system substrate-binding protein
MRRSPRRDFLLNAGGMLGLGILSGCSRLPAPAGRPMKTPRIGLFAPEPNAAWDAFDLGLRDHGYIEGQNIVVERRWGPPERFQSLAEELVALKVDVLMASLAPQVEAARRATSTIPIVFVSVNDPVGRGFVASMNRPGGNITGQANVNEETTGKRIELLRAVTPGLATLGVLINPATGFIAPVADTAQALKLRVLVEQVRDASELAGAVARLAEAGAGAVHLVQDGMFGLRKELLASLFLQHRLPAIATHREDAEAGILMAYGETVADTFRSVATYVDKILKGARPADLPVDRLTKWDLVVNLGTGRALGITIPQSVLAQANVVVQ